MGVILVTGASRGIGRGIALELAAAGHRVAVHYNGNRAAAEETVAACRDAYPPADVAATVAAPFQANVAEAADRARLVDEVIATFGSIDGLVNNAGIAPRKRDDILAAEEEIFDEVMRVNLNGPYFLTQLVARGWMDARSSAGTPAPGDSSPPGVAPIPSPAAPSGANPTRAPRRIVFITSVSATMVSTSRGEYCVSKAGLSMAAQLFAARLAGDGILVFEVRPGITATDMTAGVTAKYDRLIADGLVPQARWGVPRDTGTVVRSIMGGHLDFAPGSVIHTDGGLHIPRL